MLLSITDNLINILASLRNIPMVRFNKMIKNHLNFVVHWIGESISPVVLVFSVITHCLIFIQNKWLSLYDNWPWSSLGQTHINRVGASIIVYMIWEVGPEAPICRIETITRDCGWGKYLPSKTKQCFV